MEKFFKKVAFLALLPAMLLTAQYRFKYSSLPEHHAPDKEFHMLHLDLNLKFNIPAKEIIGRAQETIIPLNDDYMKVHLNAKAMTIKDVKIGSRKLTFEYDGNILTVNLDKAYGMNDTITYVINYTSIPPSRGIFFIMPDSAYPDVTPQIWSQSEAEDARFWYPCHDYPDDFSTSTIAVSVPSDWVAVSNGVLEKVTEDKQNNTKTFVWTEDKPHVVYLNSIVAGKFKILKTKWDNVPIYYYVPQRFVSEAEQNFSRTPDILKYFSHITGYHYPWQKLSLAAVAEFTAGGMENVSAITLTDETFHDKYAHPEERTTDLVSHETAHQWFGDLLTCRNWANIWLNEGFATYFEALYGRHAFGNDHFVYEMNRDHQNVLDAERFMNLPTVDNRYLTADDAFGSNVYERGASILYMLNHILGDKLFFKTIQYYVSHNQFQNVDTHDFEKAVSLTTGRNLYWFYDEWLYKAGHPVFNVAYKYDESSHKLMLSVKQTQQTDSLTPIYRMPVDVYIVTPAEKIMKNITVDSTENNYVFDISEKPLMVNFDEGNVLLKELDFEKSTGELSYQLKNDTNVVGRLWAAEQLGGKNDSAAEQALIAGLKNDGFYGVRAECAKSLNNFDDQAAETALLDAADDNNPDVQAAAVNSLSGFGDKNAKEKIISVFNNSKFYPVKAEAISSLADADPESAMPLVNKALEMNSYRQEIKRAALNALVKLDSVKAYEEAQKFAQYGQPESMRALAIEILVKLNLNKNKTEELLVKYSQDPNWRTRLIAINGLGRVGEKNVIPFLQKIENKIDDYRIMQSIRRSIKVIEQRNKISPL